MVNTHTHTHTHKQKQNKTIIPPIFLLRIHSSFLKIFYSLLAYLHHPSPSCIRTTDSSLALLNPSPQAQCTVRPEKTKHWNLEQRIFTAEPSKENEQFMLKIAELNGFQARFFKDSTRGEGLRMSDQLMDLLLVVVGEVTE